MTTRVFEKWLYDWDAHLKLGNPKILLLVNNYPSHLSVPNVQSSCMKLMFLLVNGPGSVNIFENTLLDVAYLTDDSEH